MNAYQIKWIAILTMIADHLGLFFFPQVIWLRIIGRLSFPLFAWLIANGAHHTHDIKNYLFRIYFFAVLSQLPFFVVNYTIDPHFSEINVLCTLFLGLMAIYCIQLTENKIIWVMATIACAAIAQLLQTDYGGFGVISVVLFYIFFNNFLELVTVYVIAVLVPIFFFQSTVFEMISLFSFVFIKLYNGEQGKRMKYFFYLFYPLQYVVYYAGLLLFN